MTDENNNSGAPDDNGEASNEAESSSAPAPSFTMDDIDRRMMNQFAAFEKRMQSMLSAPKASFEQVEEKTSMATLKREIESLRKENTEKEAAKRNVELRSTFKEVAEKLGVPAVEVRKLAAVLIDGEKVAYSNKDGLPSYKDRFGNEVDIEAGLKDFLKTEEGKSFLPPKGTAGSNDRRTSGPQPRSVAGGDTESLASMLQRVFAGEN